MTSHESFQQRESGEEREGQQRTRKEERGGGSRAFRDANERRMIRADNCEGKNDIVHLYHRLFLG